jgi:uncharacterized protein (TIGR03435 family)
MNSREISFLSGSSDCNLNVDVTAARAAVLKKLMKVSNSVRQGPLIERTTRGKRKATMINDYKYIIGHKRTHGGSPGCPGDINRRNSQFGTSKQMALMHIYAAALAIFLLAGHLPAAAHKAFEVVSVKRDVDVDARGVHFSRHLTYEGNRFSAVLDLATLVSWAFYPARPDREEFHNINDASKYYKIDAIAPAGTTIEEARVMMRTVLADRVGMQYHLENREVNIFDLVLAKGPLRLKAVSGPRENPRMSRFRMDSAAGSLADVAGFLSGYVGRNVADKTGLSGNFLLNIDWHAEMEASIAEGHGTDPTVALRWVKDVGLALEPAKEMRSVLVIDHVNTEPVPN